MSKRMPQIEFLKFLAFLVIFIWHCDTYSRGFSFVTGIPAIGAVTFFYVLSGFMTGYLQAGRKDNRISDSTVFSYVKRKIKKLYPLYFFTVILMGFFSIIPEAVARFEFERLPSAIAEMLKHLLLLQSWFPNGYFSYNCAGWFLSTLLFLYALTPLGLRLIEKNNINRLPLFVVITFLLETIYCFATRNMNLEFLHHVFPPCRLFEYFGAMMLGYYLKSVDLFLNQSEKNKIWIFTILEAASILTWLFLAFIAKPTVNWTTKILYWFFPSCFIMSVFVYGKGYISKIFSNRLFVVLGGISFECFLLHTVIIQIYHKISGDYGGISILGNLFSIAYILAITVMLSILLKKSNNH